ncbi:hypothetical protein [Brumimicrobium oceani]|uniref:hypothetical protein n=1 Tax=Brumimicrobium oceani TaxID=2100725 RepID=UPI001304E200|nr:hypothetical protein [Brumimicrobium oceani]
MAFYHWKYAINKTPSRNDWEEFVFHSQEEFKLLKEGILNDINVRIPVKAFGYKVVLKD